MSKIITLAARALLTGFVAAVPILAYILLHIAITMAIGKLVGYLMERYVFEPAKAQNPDLDDRLWQEAMKKAGRPVVVQ